MVRFVSASVSEAGNDNPSICSGNGGKWRADARIRTADPIITSDVLYQLSYVGEAP